MTLKALVPIFAIGIVLVPLTMLIAETNPPGCISSTSGDTSIVTISVPTVLAGEENLFTWTVDGLGLSDPSALLQIDTSALHKGTHSVAASSKSATVLCTILLASEPILIDRTVFENAYPPLNRDGLQRLDLQRQLSGAQSISDARRQTLFALQRSHDNLLETIVSQRKNVATQESYIATVSFQETQLRRRLKDITSEALIVDSKLPAVCRAFLTEECQKVAKQRSALHVQIVALSDIVDRDESIPSMEPQPQGGMAPATTFSVSASSDAAIGSPSTVDLRQQLASLSDEQVRDAEMSAQLAVTNDQLASQLKAVSSVVDAATHASHYKFAQYSQLIQDASTLSNQVHQVTSAYSLMVAGSNVLPTPLAERALGIDQELHKDDDLLRSTIESSNAGPPPPNSITVASVAFTKADDLRSRIIKVFYVTEREAGPGAVISFGDGRSLRNTVHFGTAMVTVPARHRIGIIEQPTWWKFERHADSKSSFTISLVAQSEGNFYQAVRLQLQQYSPGKKQVFVFVHGFNNSFDDALLRTAQLAADIGFDGAPIMYDWPSCSSVFRYTADRNAIGDSTEGLENFLQQLSAKTGATSINVIAHSMGGFGVLTALDDLVHKGKAPHLNQLILAAPDIDQIRIRKIIPELVAAKVSKRTTLYASHADLALRASFLANKVVASGGAPPIIVLEGMDTIDSSSLEGTILGHDYFADTRAVLTDIYLLFKDSAPPPRMGLQEVGEGSSRHWMFTRGQ